MTRAATISLSQIIISYCILVKGDWQSVRLLISKSLTLGHYMRLEIQMVTEQILTGFIYNGIAKFEEGSSSVYNDQFTFFIDKKGNRILNLPIVTGSGELYYHKTLIKGEIDFRLFYVKRNGEPVWKQNTVIPLKEPYVVVEEKYKPNKDFLVYYPQIAGMLDRKTQAKINQLLKDLAGIKAPSYMAPEQWTGAPASAADVYAATATFFECLTGRKPYTGENLAELALQHVDGAIPADEVPSRCAPWSSAAWPIT